MCRLRLQRGLCFGTRKPCFAMKNRVIIANVQPEIDGGRYFIKRVAGESVHVSADVLADGHDALRASLLFRHEHATAWEEVPMASLENDVWEASFTVRDTGFYTYTIHAWIDHLLNWHQGFLKKYADGQLMDVELRLGAQWLERTAALYAGDKATLLLHYADLLGNPDKQQQATEAVLSSDFAALVSKFPAKLIVTEYTRELRVRVGRERELFSSWYEVFPRSCSPDPGRPGTLRDVEQLLPRVHALGFDVLYLPPVHPVGKKNRKGRNNSVTALPHEPGSPWAIGNDEGGHKAINPELGTLEDYRSLISKAAGYGIEIALDLAFQCAPDHPYIQEHPAWFVWRPDGTIAYAENPPKKYQDIVPINFETDDWEALWEELRSVILFWCEQGVRIFRVDNPHTKAFHFWDWAINSVQQQYPDTIFLSEAFTRPKVMAQLAKGGFTQSYTYFTWRNTKADIEAYMLELTRSPLREFFRPNFWPNTPDILPYELMGAGQAKFAVRLVLAATLSSNYGMYAPAYEFMENTGSSSGKEEYEDSEKYVVRHYDWTYRTAITELTASLNRIRRSHPALQSTWNIHFTRTDNDMLMSYVKLTDDRSDVIWCVVNLDEKHVQHGYVETPKALLGIHGGVRLRITDLLTGEVYHWFNDWNYVELRPAKQAAHLFAVEFLADPVENG